MDSDDLYELLSSSPSVSTITSLCFSPISTLSEEQVSPFFFTMDNTENSSAHSPPDPIALNFILPEDQQILSLPAPPARNPSPANHPNTSPLTSPVPSPVPSPIPSPIHHEPVSHPSHGDDCSVEIPDDQSPADSHETTMDGLLISKLDPLRAATLKKLKRKFQIDDDESTGRIHMPAPSSEPIPEMDIPEGGSESTSPPPAPYHVRTRGRKEKEATMAPRPRSSSGPRN